MCCLHFACRSVPKCANTANGKGQVLRNLHVIRTQRANQELVHICAPPSWHGMAPPWQALLKLGHYCLFEFHSSCGMMYKERSVCLPRKLARLRYSGHVELLESPQGVDIGPKIISSEQYPSTRKESKIKLLTKKVEIFKTFH